MANPEHLAILKRGVEEWNAWRQHQEVEPDLGGAQLRGAYLREANFNGANLGGADLCRADLGGAGLREANLSKADLSAASLPIANLVGANLLGARLRAANLHGAHLVEVRGASEVRTMNLNGVDLSQANFSAVNLRRANLREADLLRTNFFNANLSEADVTGARLAYTMFVSTCLYEVRGLAECNHEGASTVDYETIELSGEMLPLPFLQGVGLPDWLIDSYRGYLGSPIEFYSCFISYNHTDKVFARRLHDQLQGRGIRCWLDEHQLKPGDDIYEGVDRGIRMWDKVLLCCSEASLSSWWVEREVDTAIEKERQLREQHGEPRLALIPLNLDGSMFDWKGAHGATLRKRLAADFTGWEQDNATFEAQFERVVAALRSDEGAREAPPVSKL